MQAQTNNSKYEAIYYISDSSDLALTLKLATIWALWQYTLTGHPGGLVGFRLVNSGRPLDDYLLCLHFELAPLLRWRWARANLQMAIFAETSLELCSCRRRDLACELWAIGNTHEVLALYGTRLGEQCGFKTNRLSGNGAFNPVKG
jgi:hypothetical protein